MTLPAPIRRLAERLSRHIVLRKHLPPEAGGGDFWTSPDVALKYWRPSLRGTDEGLFRLAEELVAVDDVVWDVGASVGLFAIAAAFRAGRLGKVVAFEPDPWVANLLRRSAAAAPEGHAGVSVVEVAICDRCGSASFEIASRGRAASHLAEVAGTSQASHARARSRVSTRTLDSLLEDWPAPAVVKIDVEGGELAAIRGGERLWRQVRPVALLEVGNSSREGVGTLFRELDYVLFDAAAPSGHRAPLETPSWNSLLIPGESPRRSRWQKLDAR